MGIAQPMQPIATPNFPNQRTGPFGVLDIGSSKIVCMIGRLDHDGHIDVMGQGCSKSLGVRGGNICDLDGAKRTIRAAIATAEKRAKFRLSSVTVNLSCGQPESRILSVEYPLHGRQINDAELHQLGAEARARAISPGRETIHCLPISIEVPETILVTGGPVGLCDVASARFHVIDAMSTALRNLGGTVGRCGLEITDVVSAAFAAGISSLTDDERKLGATLIDMGGGTTDIAVFAGGHLLYTAQIPVGGQHVTRDIAGVFGTSIEHAERLKILYGTIVECEDDDSEMIALQLIGEVENQFTHVPRSALTKIIRLRVQEIFELVRGRVDNDALGRAASQVTLTGGASQIPGMRDMATKVLGRPAQLGRIPELNGLDENSYDPSLATAAGLLAWSANELQAYGEHNFAMSSRQRIGRIVRSLVDQV
jgi:cell division protein FtsA